MPDLHSPVLPRQKPPLNEPAKPVKYTVAVILRDRANPKGFLVVQRPPDDRDLGGHWGFPAATLKSGELIEMAAQRVCREKLHCAAVPTRFVGAMFQKRNNYDLLLVDIEMLLVGDQQPDCHQATTTRTRYVDQKWTTDPLVLLPGAQKGSCCSSIFLTDEGLLNRADWIGSLEGSRTVG